MADAAEVDARPPFEPNTPTIKFRQSATEARLADTGNSVQCSVCLEKTNTPVIQCENGHAMCMVVYDETGNCCFQELVGVWWQEQRETEGTAPSLKMECRGRLADNITPCETFLPIDQIRTFFDVDDFESQCQAEFARRGLWRRDVLEWESRHASELSDIEEVHERLMETVYKDELCTFVSINTDGSLGDRCTHSMGEPFKTWDACGALVCGPNHRMCAWCSRVVYNSTYMKHLMLCGSGKLVELDNTLFRKFQYQLVPPTGVSLIRMQPTTKTDGIYISSGRNDNRYGSLFASTWSSTFPSALTVNLYHSLRKGGRESQCRALFRSYPAEIQSRYLESGNYTTLIQAVFVALRDEDYPRIVEAVRDFAINNTKFDASDEIPDDVSFVYLTRHVNYGIHLEDHRMYHDRDIARERRYLVVNTARILKDIVIQIRDLENRMDHWLRRADSPMWSHAPWMITDRIPVMESLMDSFGYWYGEYVREDLANLRLLLVLYRRFCSA